MGVVLAVAVVGAAVKRYKQLTEGPCAGRVVARLQDIDGVLFRYSPPPVRRVPLAAQVESAGAADELLSRAQRQEHCRRDEDLMRARVRQLRAARAAGPREA